MNIQLLLLFIVLNVLNVVLQTLKNIITIKAGKTAAALINAVTFGFYTIIIVYMNCELSLLAKVLVVGACNLVGVYIVKWGEEKARRDKLWKIELTVRQSYKKSLDEALAACDISHNCMDIERTDHVVFNVYCKTQKESHNVRELAQLHNAKFCVFESKTL